MILEKIFKSDDKKIIAQIHNEFDTAQDRLLHEAKDILSGLHIPSVMKFEEKAERLQNIGFINAPTVKKTEELRIKRKTARDKEAITQSGARLIEQYKMEYPFLKFLTESELDRICKKYKLIYAPIKNYIKDVPEKNIKEIENAQEFKFFHETQNKFTVKVKKFQDDCPKSLRDCLKGEVEYTGDVYGNGRPDGNDLLNLARKRGYSGSFDGYIFRNATVKEFDRQGLFICAPPSHFELSRLERKGKLGYYNVTIREIKDPIVFRYCKGGVQVLSKWGLEAEDEALVNGINN